MCVPRPRPYPVAIEPLNPVPAGFANTMRIRTESTCSNGLVFEAATGQIDFNVTSGNTILHLISTGLIFDVIPTSDPGVAGQVWDNSGVLNISAG